MPVIAGQLTGCAVRNGRHSTPTVPTASLLPFGARAGGASYGDGVIVIYPDTNSLYGDLLMRGRSSGELLALLSPGEIEVRLSPVVVEEARRQLQERAHVAVQGIRQSARRVRKDFDPVPDEITEQLITGIEAQSSSALKPLLEHPACKMLPWSTVSARVLVARELDGRRPTLLKGDHTVGLRDTVIWHDLLELVDRLGDEHQVIFITADKGFLDDGALHPDLVAEVGSLRLPAARLRVVADLARAATVVGTLTDRERALRTTLLDTVQFLDRDLWLNRDETVNEAPLPHELRNPTLEAVEGVEILAIGDGEPARCVATALLAFHGVVDMEDVLSIELDPAWSVTTFGAAPGTTDFTMQAAVTATIYTEISYDRENRTTTLLDRRVVWTDEEQRLWREDRDMHQSLLDVDSDLWGGSPTDERDDPL